MQLIVMCPDGPITGGVEALHQLVDAAARQSIDASICYYPPGRSEIVPAYAHYQVPVATHVPDNSDVVVLVPETSPLVLTVLHRARKALWWLSVDNFFGKQALSVTDDDPALLTELLQPAAMVTHLSQSAYARDFLFRRRVRSAMLTDYLSDAFVQRATQLQSQPKKDLVLYNPRKGLAFTERLIAASQSVLEWQPIEGLTADGVAELLGSAKLYVDFGEHPGRDRIPREAAISGCAVITGRRGAAGFAEDLPVPQRFRLDEQSPGVVEEFLAVATDTLTRFDEVSQEFGPYREWIAGQRERFFGETLAFWTEVSRPRIKGVPAGGSTKAKAKAKKRR
ncbi:hypothetical protein M6D93_16790 [Jatrophihabitans telluris]|uniref:Glycosyltransferase family 1 protein n=1 Tax=Jatrophihabitans telluris TaxID=2038343 RepID=A0ABY4QXT0_9ACTN|nr:hypothetical protein [Jatrophihabitans telluris]UQX87942.1 hypothetical protein M6D93_16790 [Jatrophihabitans telluris]